jgi:hypothetical protein
MVQAVYFMVKTISSPRVDVKHARMHT